MADVRSPDAGTLGPVDLWLPADASMSKVVRLAASGVASLGGFSVEEIEDIKLAVSEVLIALIEHGSGQPVDIRISVTPDEFDIRGATPISPSFDIDELDLMLCRIVLEGVCNEHSLDQIGTDVRITARLQRPFRGL